MGELLYQGSGSGLEELQLYLHARFAVPTNTFRFFARKR